MQYQNSQMIVGYYIILLKTGYSDLLRRLKTASLAASIATVVVQGDVHIGFRERPGLWQTETDVLDSHAAIQPLLFPAVKAG